MLKKGLRPKYLCKYYSYNDYTIDVINNNQIYFAPLKSFNDPFENIFHVNRTFNSSGKYKLSNGKEIENEQQHNKFIDELLEQMNTHYFPSIGVSCFTILPSNFLMWSHYAANHSGLCMVYDTTRDEDFFKEAEKISYYKSLPIIDMFKEDPIEQFIEVLYSKSMEWKYEQEYRIVRNKIGVHSFKLEALEYVIFGCQMKDNIKKELADAISKKYDNVLIIDSFIHPKEYKIIHSNYKTGAPFEFEYLIDFDILGQPNYFDDAST